MEINTIYNENCLDTMRRMPDNFLDSIVTDPPYGLAFMGKKWDYDVPSVEIWQECLRVLKPGGYLLAFAGTRTQHRMAVRIEDAGFEIRDMIAWVYGSGFPKSLNIGKAVDKLQGNERNIIGTKNGVGKQNPEWNGTAKGRKENSFKPEYEDTKGNSEWEGWGTALKPALEPITVARKPFTKTVAENVLEWGTGGINIDACRVGENAGWKYPNGRGGSEPHHMERGEKNGIHNTPCESQQGRFPANLIHDGSEEVLGLFPHTKSGAMKKSYEYQNNGYSLGKPSGSTKQIHDASEGSAARFFYCAKASKAERNYGCEALETKQTQGGGGGIGNYQNDVNSASGKFGSEKAPAQNNHPTVKPIALIKYLVQLVTRPNGLTYDPFGGSGTLKLAAQEAEVNYIISELSEEYCQIAEARKTKQILQPQIINQPTLF